MKPKDVEVLRAAEQTADESIAQWSKEKGE